MADLSSDLKLTLAVARANVATNSIFDAFASALGYDEFVQQYVEVANGAVDQAVSFGPVTTGQLLLLVSDKTVSFKLNGGATGVDAQCLLVAATSLTALSVSNSSGVTAKVRVSILGT